MDDEMKAKLMEAARLLEPLFSEPEMAMLLLVRHGQKLEVLRSHIAGNSDEMYQEMLDVAKDIIAESDGYVVFENPKSN